jgi:AAA15 family ATPase/GTPase
MQFRRVSIKAFRGIQDLEFYDLGRINLLVGQNNCGKTSVLEAMHVLGNCKVNGTFPYSKRINSQEANNEINIDKNYKIYKHYIPVHSKEQMLFISGYEPLEIESKDESEKMYDGKFTAAYIQYNLAENRIEQRQYTTVNFRNNKFDDLSTFLGDMYPETYENKVHLNSEVELNDYYNNNLSYEWLKKNNQLIFKKEKWIILKPNSAFGLKSKVQIMDLDDDYKYILQGVSEAIDKGTLPSIVETLHDLDSEITDVDTVDEQVLIYKLEVEGENRNAVVPLEYFGAATIRMLSLLIKLSECENGMLMIDEIDTAMHYTYLEQIWDTLIKGAEKFKVQVFVTTHSDECVKALAEVLREQKGDDYDKIKTEEVRMYHIQKNTETQLTKAFKYDAHHIASLSQPPYIEYR